MKASALFSSLSFGMSTSASDIKSCMLAIKALEAENALLRIQKETSDHHMEELQNAGKVTLSPSSNLSSTEHTLCALDPQFSQLFTELREHYVKNFGTQSEFIGRTDVHPHWHTISDILSANIAQGESGTQSRQAHEQEN